MGVAKEVILVFGENGQVAQSLKWLAPGAEFLGSKTVDFLHPDQVVSTLNRKRPDFVINAAAYTAVDKAEVEREQAQKINFESVREIANWCARHGKTLIHYSTDYVFDGSGTQVLEEDALKAPVNWYGLTKLKSEKAISESGCRAFIFRVSWVYSHVGTNFVRTMLKLASEREELRIVSDQVGAPTYAEDIAMATVRIVEELRENKNYTPGIYHMSGGKHDYDFLSWYDFAMVIFKHARVIGMPLKIEKIKPISTAEFPTAAQRPANSRLNNSKFLKEFGFAIPTWQQSLSVCIRRIYEGQ